MENTKKQENKKLLKIIPSTASDQKGTWSGEPVRVNILFSLFTFHMYDVCVMCDVCHGCSACVNKMLIGTNATISHKP